MASPSPMTPLHANDGLKNPIGERNDSEGKQGLSTGLLGSMSTTMAYPPQNIKGALPVTHARTAAIRVAASRNAPSRARVSQAIALVRAKSHAAQAAAAADIKGRLSKPAQTNAEPPPSLFRQARTSGIESRLSWEHATIASPPAPRAARAFSPASTIPSRALSPASSIPSTTERTIASEVQTPAASLKPSMKSYREDGLNGAGNKVYRMTPPPTRSLILGDTPAQKATAQVLTPVASSSVVASPVSTGVAPSPISTGVATAVDLGLRGAFSPQETKTTGVISPPPPGVATAVDKNLAYGMVSPHSKSTSKTGVGTISPPPSLITTAVDKTLSHPKFSNPPSAVHSPFIPIPSSPTPSSAAQATPTENLSPPQEFFRNVFASGITGPVHDPPPDLPTLGIDNAKDVSVAAAALPSPARGRSRRAVALAAAAGKHPASVKSPDWQQEKTAVIDSSSGNEPVPFSESASKLTDSAASEPAATEPSTSEPAASEPSTSEPVTSEPALVREDSSSVSSSEDDYSVDGSVDPETLADVSRFIDALQMQKGNKPGPVVTAVSAALPSSAEGGNSDGAHVKATTPVSAFADPNSTQKVTRVKSEENATRKQHPVPASSANLSIDPDMKESGNSAALELLSASTSKDAIELEANDPTTAKGAGNDDMFAIDDLLPETTISPQVKERVPDEANNSELSARLANVVTSGSSSKVTLQQDSKEVFSDDDNTDLSSDEDSVPLETRAGIGAFIDSLRKSSKTDEVPTIASGGMYMSSSDDDSSGINDEGMVSPETEAELSAFIDTISKPRLSAQASPIVRDSPPVSSAHTTEMERRDGAVNGTLIAESSPMEEQKNSTSLSSSQISEPILEGPQSSLNKLSAETSQELEDDNALQVDDTVDSEPAASRYSPSKAESGPPGDKKIPTSSQLSEPIAEAQTQSNFSMPSAETSQVLEDEDALHVEQTVDSKSGTSRSFPLTVESNPQGVPKIPASLSSLQISKPIAEAPQSNLNKPSGDSSLDHEDSDSSQLEEIVDSERATPRHSPLMAESGTAETPKTPTSLSSSSVPETIVEAPQSHTNKPSPETTPDLEDNDAMELEEIVDSKPSTPIQSPLIAELDTSGDLKTSASCSSSHISESVGEASQSNLNQPSTDTSPDLVDDGVLEVEKTVDSKPAISKHSPFMTESSTSGDSKTPSSRSPSQSSEPIAEAPSAETSSYLEDDDDLQLEGTVAPMPATCSHTPVDKSQQILSGDDSSDTSKGVEDVEVNEALMALSAAIAHPSRRINEGLPPTFSGVPPEDTGSEFEDDAVDDALAAEFLTRGESRTNTPRTSPTEEQVKSIPLTVEADSSSVLEDDAVDDILTAEFLGRGDSRSSTPRSSSVEDQMQNIPVPSGAYPSPAPEADTVRGDSKTSTPRLTPAENHIQNSLVTVAGGSSPFRDDDVVEDALAAEFLALGDTKATKMRLSLTEETTQISPKTHSLDVNDDAIDDALVAEFLARGNSKASTPSPSPIGELVQAIPQQAPAATTPNFAGDAAYKLNDEGGQLGKRGVADTGDRAANEIAGEQSTAPTEDKYYAPEKPVEYVQDTALPAVSMNTKANDIVKLGSEPPDKYAALSDEAKHSGSISDYVMGRGDGIALRDRSLLDGDTASDTRSLATMTPTTDILNEIVDDMDKEGKKIENREMGTTSTVSPTGELEKINFYVNRAVELTKRDSVSDAEIGQLLRNAKREGVPEEAIKKIFNTFFEPGRQRQKRQGPPESLMPSDLPSSPQPPSKAVDPQNTHEFLALYAPPEGASSTEIFHLNKFITSATLLSRKPTPTAKEISIVIEAAKKAHISPDVVSKLLPEGYVPIPAHVEPTATDKEKAKNSSRTVSPINGHSFSGAKSEQKPPLSPRTSTPSSPRLNSPARDSLSISRKPSNVSEASSAIEPISTLYSDEKYDEIEQVDDSEAIRAFLSRFEELKAGGHFPNSPGGTQGEHAFSGDENVEVDLNYGFVRKDFNVSKSGASSPALEENPEALSEKEKGPAKANDVFRSDVGSPAMLEGKGTKSPEVLSEQGEEVTEADLLPHNDVDSTVVVEGNRAKTPDDVLSEQGEEVTEMGIVSGGGMVSASVAELDRAKPPMLKGEEVSEKHTVEAEHGVDSEPKWHDGEKAPGKLPWEVSFEKDNDNNVDDNDGNDGNDQSTEGSLFDEDKEVELFVMPNKTPDSPVSEEKEEKGELETKTMDGNETDLMTEHVRILQDLENMDKQREVRTSTDASPVRKPDSSPLYNKKAKVDLEPIGVAMEPLHQSTMPNESCDYDDHSANRYGSMTMSNDEDHPPISPSRSMLSGVEAAASVVMRPLKKSSKQQDQVPIYTHWKLPYAERTRGHKGYVDVDVYSLYEATVVVDPGHPLDLMPWEYRDVKQRFLHEKSVRGRNWFGRMYHKPGNDRYHEPICHPKSMEIPMRNMPEPGEWAEDWYTTWQSRKENPNNLVEFERDEIKAAERENADKENAHDDKYRYATEVRTEDESWEEHPEVGILCTVRIKIGQRVSRVHPKYTSNLRHSRWRRKYFPRGTFPF